MKRIGLAIFTAAFVAGFAYQASAFHECFNNIDDDGDGFIDDDDPGCAGPLPFPDGLETSPDLPCDDGIDNDFDGLIDSGVGANKDPGCRDPEWPLEDPHCNDGVDSERQADEAPDGTTCVVGVPGDGFIDFPDDLGCSAPWDLTETDPMYVCDDGIDNDGDNRIDFGGGLETWPNGNCWRQPDTDCTHPWDDPFEVIMPTGEEQCSNGIDDDGDTLIDLADFGCAGGFDNNERLGTTCDDGVDNDADGLTDFPADPECDSPQDGNERPPGVPVASLGGGGMILLILSIGSVTYGALRRKASSKVVIALMFLIVGLAVSNSAQARTLSSAGVLCAHATNELLSAPLAYIDEASAERSWVGGWYRWPLLPFTGTARMMSRVGAWFVTGFGAVPLEVFTYKYREGTGMIAPLHPDPHWTVVSQSALLPKCDWHWASEAPDCLVR